MLMRLRNNKITEMEQQDDIVQNASEGEDRDTQPMVPITKEIRHTQDRDTADDSMNKSNPITLKTLVDMIKEEMRKMNDNMHAKIDSSAQRLGNNMHDIRKEISYDIDNKMHEANKVINENIKKKLMKGLHC